MQVRSYLWRFAAWALLVAWLSIPSLGQVNLGRISGVISDDSGAVVPNLVVRVINQDTGVERTATTNEVGAYLLPNLPVGLYTIKLEAAGFQPAERTGLNLVADGRLSVNIALHVASAAQSVEVVASAGEQVNTVSGEISRVVGTEQVANLALNGRNYMQLATLIPGSVLLDEDQMATTTSLSVNTQAVNGNRNNSNSLSVDGSYNLDSGSNGSQMNNVGVDFIREVNIKTSNFSAEYGRNSGAAINVITRGGTNEFHGGALEFVRNDVLDARSFFSPRKAKLRFNDFGWNLGGPIRKNKLFFFAGQEWKKIRQEASPRLATLPTHAQRKGDFSGVGGNLFLPGTTTPVPNRNISQMITPDGRAIANVFDGMESLAVSYTDTPTANNTVFLYPNPFDWRQDLVRLDYAINDRHSLYGRYLHDMYNLVDPYPVSGLPTVPINRVRPATSYQVTHTWIISPSLLNEARGAASWHRQRRKPATDTWMRSTYDFQYPQVFNGGPYENGIPSVNVSGYTNFSGPSFIILSPTADISFTDNLTWIRGNHALKTGVQITRNRKDQNANTNHAGNVGFSTSGNSMTTGNALADALLGNYRTYNESNDDPIGFLRFTQYDAYVQDSWKVTRRLSLECGIRVQYGTPLYATANNVTNFDPSRYDPAQAVTITPAGLRVANSGNPYNGLIRAGDGVPEDQLGRVPGATTPEALSVPTGAPRGLYPPQTLFAPRFGFAWADGRSRTAIRGGFGMFYDRIDGNVFLPTLANPPYLRSVALENGKLADPTSGKAAALVPFSGIVAIDPHLATPTTMNYSLSVDRELPHGVLVEASYVGNLGRHLLRSPDINQPWFDLLTANAALPNAQRASTNYLRPYKGYSTISQRKSDSTSNYHALQLHANKRKGKLQMTGSYTWSKSLSDSSTEFDNPENYLNRHFSYGPSGMDRRHILVGTYTYQLPFAKQWAKPLRWTLGGWEVSGINRFQTGSFSTVTGNTSIGVRRADYVGGSVALPAGQRSPQRYFNTAAFATAPDIRYGNSGVGLIEGPSLFLWDLSLRKRFPVTERVNLRFQGDMFNLLNHTNFRNPSVVVTNLDFGRINTAGPARNVQLGLKVQF